MKKVRECLNDIIKVYDQVERALSIIQIVKLYLILKKTLYYRINSYCNKALYKILKQRLILEKKKSIKSQILKI